MNKIATRGSRLALRQSGMVQELLKEKSGLESELMIVKTTGDIIHDKPLSEIRGAGFFTKEIEQALIDGSAQIAVHSLKDLPIQQPPGLKLAAIVEREDPAEVIVTRPENVDPDKPLTLKTDLTVGTSAIRRKAQLRLIRPDLKVKEMRGNVTSRLEKVRNGEYDAIMIAHAGLKRVGVELDSLEVCVQKLEEFVPAPAQGALAVETRSDDGEISLNVSKINHAETRMAVEAERRLLLLCGGGCHLPLGANVSGAGDEWQILVFWSYRLPDKTERYVRMKLQSANLDELVEESYAAIKSAEIYELGRYFERESKVTRRLLITRPDEKIIELKQKLKDKSVEVVSYPVLKLDPAYDEDHWKRIESKFSEYKYIVLTSANAVEIFRNLLSEKAISSHDLADKIIATVGAKTAEACKEYFGESKIIASPNRCRPWRTPPEFRERQSAVSMRERGGS
jgi:hydroxymethylbilane synthase